MYKRKTGKQVTARMEDPSSCDPSGCLATGGKAILTPLVKAAVSKASGASEQQSSGSRAGTGGGGDRGPQGRTRSRSRARPDRGARQRCPPKHLQHPLISVAVRLLRHGSLKEDFPAWIRWAELANTQGCQDVEGLGKPRGRADRQRLAAHRDAMGKGQQGQGLPAAEDSAGAHDPGRSHGRSGLGADRLGLAQTERTDRLALHDEGSGRNHLDRGAVR
jgi:hypothetical protein